MSEQNILVIAAKEQAAKFLEYDPSSGRLVKLDTLLFLQEISFTDIYQSYNYPQFTILNSVIKSDRTECNSTFMVRFARALAAQIEKQRRWGDFHNIVITAPNMMLDMLHKYLKARTRFYIVAELTADLYDQSFKKIIDYMNPYVHTTKVTNLHRSRHENSANTIG